MTGDIASYGGYPSFADRVLEQLQQWPSLEAGRGGPFVTLRLPGGAAPVARLRQPDVAELCLTWPVVQRISGPLAGSGPVLVQEGNDWVSIRMAGTSDMRLVLLLASLAIRAHRLKYPLRRSRG